MTESLFIKSGKSTILQTVKKEYVTIEETEYDLKEKFMQAVYSENQVVKKLKNILATESYQRYDYRENEEIELTEELISALKNIDGNIIDLAESCYIYNDGNTTTFLKRKWLPCEKVIVMSATASAETYRMLTYYSVYDYPCKMAEYTGKLKLYPKYTFSRHALLEQNRIM